MQAGATNYIPKPIDNDLLFSVLDKERSALNDRQSTLAFRESLRTSTRTQLAPSSSPQMTQLAGAISDYAGRSEEALPCFERAMALDPLCPNMWLHGAGVFSVAALRRGGSGPQAADFPLSRDRTSREYCWPTTARWGASTRPASNGGRRCASTRTIPLSTAGKCCPIRTPPISRPSWTASGRLAWLTKNGSYNE